MPDYSIKITVPAVIDKIIVFPLLAFRKIWYGYSFRRIRLIPNKYAIVEPADFHEISKYTWWTQKNGSYYSAVHYFQSSNGGRFVAMHRKLIKPPKNRVVDHINRNPLDNRRLNLRIVTWAQNNMNSCGKIGSSSKYKGVSKCRKNNSWRASIRVNKKNSELGYFDCEMQAARVYDNAAKKYYGEFAYLNFPPDNGPQGLRGRLIDYRLSIIG